MQPVKQASLENCYCLPSLFFFRWFGSISFSPCASKWEIALNGQKAGENKLQWTEPEKGLNWDWKRWMKHQQRKKVRAKSEQTQWNVTVTAAESSGQVNHRQQMQPLNKPWWWEGAGWGCLTEPHHTTHCSFSLKYNHLFFVKKKTKQCKTKQRKQKITKNLHILIGGYSLPVSQHHNLVNRTKIANFKRNRKKSDKNFIVSSGALAQQGIKIYVKVSMIPHLLWKLLYSSARRCFTPSGSVWDAKKAEAILEADMCGNSGSKTGSRITSLSASHLHEFCVKRLQQHKGKDTDWVKNDPKRSAIHVEISSGHSRGYVFLDVVSPALILAVFNRSFKDRPYFTWLSEAYIDHSVAPRTPTVKEAGQQHPADQNHSEDLLSGGREPRLHRVQRWFLLFPLI